MTAPAIKSESKVAPGQAWVSLEARHRIPSHMVTSEEQPLLTGDPEGVEGFVDCDRCLLVDGRGSEEEVLDDASQFLPDGRLSYEISDADADSATLRIRFQDREDEISLPAQPRNTFRVLLRLATLLEPDHGMRLFRCTGDSDTNGFLIRPAAWWSTDRSAYSKQDAELFHDFGEVNRLWGLDKAPQSDA